jgi:hypothetical protein
MRTTPWRAFPSSNWVPTMSISPRRALITIVTLVAITSAGRVTAQSDPFLGVWEMSHSKSSVTRGTAPRSEMLVIVAEADGLKSTLVTINEGQGRAEIHHYKFDGNPHPTEGGDVRHLTFKRTGPRSAEVTTVRSGEVTATRRMEVSSDGKTLSFNGSGKSSNGTPFANDLRVYVKSY